MGKGAWLSYEQEMPIWAPPVPNRDVFPTEISHSMNSVSIRFRRNYFSDVNGKVIAYAVSFLVLKICWIFRASINLIFIFYFFILSGQIIVAEDYRKSTQDKPNLPKWQDVQKFRTWPPYQVSDAYYPFNNSSVEDFTIGTENCENKVKDYWFEIENNISESIFKLCET